MKLYNTLTKKKEDFNKKIGEIVTIYSCGPTVYNYAHIGNLKTYIFMDILRKALVYEGFKLRHAMNITDVGHLVSDADVGEDKVVKAAKEQNKKPLEITSFYTEAFFRDINCLNIQKPEIICKATEHIADMIKYVEEIIKNGYAYETSKGIYFDISKLNNYGVLSGVNLEGQMIGARVDEDKEKKNPLDFALWIKAPENHIMKWDSPWGKSYPGWHLECSAMSRKYLGETFDIHTGGIDHVSIHHENEIAQSIGATGKIPARIWMHSEFLLMDGGKMSKSLGNVYTIGDIIKKGYSPLSFRYLCLNTHYRNKLNFTFEGLKSAQISLNRLTEGLKAHLKGNDEVTLDELEEKRIKFKESINDDLNTPKALSVVWEIIRGEKKSKKYLPLIKEFDEILCLDLSVEKIIKKDTNEKEEVSDEVKELINKRQIARENKNWNEADKIRQKLESLGIRVLDTKEGVKIEIID